EKRRAGADRPAEVISTKSDRASSAEILFEERDGPGPRLFRMHGMEGRAIVALEAVVGVGVEDDLGRLAGFFQRVAKFVDFGDWNEGVLAAEKRQHRRIEAVDVVDRSLRAGLRRLHDPAAIVRRGGSDSRIAACGQKGNAPAHAESDGAERRLYFL